MRKFRVWDNQNECYSEEPFWRLLLCKDGKIYNSENDTYYNFDERYTVEFSTGLKDRNKNEIYENDIVNIPYNHIGDKSVEFKDGRYNISNYNISVCLVIGNIHDKTNEK